MSVLNITKENFINEVMESKQPVLIDFWAAWCGPCKMIGPIVEEVASEVEDLKVVKINVDEQPELAQQYGVMSIPTLVIMKDGKEVNKAIGLRPKEDLIKLVKESI